MKNVILIYRFHADWQQQWAGIPGGAGSPDQGNMSGSHNGGGPRR